MACQATLGAYGDGVWSVSRCSVLVDMVSGVSGDVGRLWKWCNTGVAYGMYSAQSASLSLSVNDSTCSAGKPFGYHSVSAAFARVCVGVCMRNVCVWCIRVVCVCVCV